MPGKNKLETFEWNEFSLLRTLANFWLTYTEPPASRIFASRLPPFFAFLPSPSKLEGFQTRISHKTVPGRTIRRPFIIHFFTKYILINVNIIDRFCTLS